MGTNVLTSFLAVSSSTGLYFMKGDKDFDEGERSQDDRQFQHSKKPVMPKNRAESVPDVKENEIALSQVEPNDPPGRKAVKEVPKHFRISNLLEEVDPGTGEGIEEDDDDNEGDSEDSETDEEPTIFALANTDVGRNWEGIPFREKYLWGSPDALCHPFDLPIPHEGTDDGNLTICLYRREMPSSRDVSLLVIPEVSPPTVQLNQVLNSLIVSCNLSHHRFRILWKERQMFMVTSTDIPSRLLWVTSSRGNFF